jgi:hypothetical protein
MPRFDIIFELQVVYRCLHDEVFVVVPLLY